MKQETATTIARLARQMIIEAHEKFEHEEFIHSLILFNKVVSTLMMNDQNDNNGDEISK